MLKRSSASRKLTGQIFFFSLFILFSGKSPTELREDLVQSLMVNVVGNIELFNIFLPLIKKGNAKKVVSISSGMADLEFISRFDIAAAGPYSISKAAMNAAVAKFAAEYKKEGILFMSISPGYVETGQSDHCKSNLCTQKKKKKEKKRKKKEKKGKEKRREENETR
jgi:NAD(P)-dependent dehydrogenase (short-subunit alcohol dehydrogenase family)